MPRDGYEEVVVPLRPWPLTSLTAAAAASLTLVVTLLPNVAFAYRSVSLHVALEVAAALIALLAAFLVYLRFRESSRVDHLALVCGLATTAGANLLFAALPAAAPGLGSDRFATWAAVAGRLVGAALLVAAAFLPRRELRRPRAEGRVALLACLGLLASVAIVVAAIDSRLPTGIDPSLSPTARNEPLLAGHASVHAVQLVAFLLYAAAAVGFARRAARGGAELDVWLACACVVAAFARVHYFLFPSLYSEWVYTGDLFRLGFYLLLLAGAARAIAALQRRASSAAVFEERRRLARDLHDGLAQELGFIVMHSRSRLAAGQAQEELEPIAVAAERAVDEARRAIAALTRPIDEPLDVALAQAVEDVAHRTGATVRLDLAADVRVQPRTREELLRIVREAVSNAVRHAHPHVVTVELQTGDCLRLRVRDDGIGFDPRKTRIRGHGLTSMCERARALGAELTVDSTRGGTSVEVVVPHAQ